MCEAPASIITPMITTKTWKQSRSAKGPARFGDAADEVVVVVRALGVGDQRDAEEGHQRVSTRLKTKIVSAARLRFANFGWAISRLHLREGLLAAQGQDGVPKPMKGPPAGRPAAPCRRATERPGVKIHLPEVGSGTGCPRAPAASIPQKMRAATMTGYLHDGEGLRARLLDPDQVQAPEVEDDENGEKGGPDVARQLQGISAKAASSLIKPTRWCPAETPLIGAVRRKSKMRAETVALAAVGPMASFTTR